MNTIVLTELVKSWRAQDELTSDSAVEDSERGCLFEAHAEGERAGREQCAKDLETLVALYKPLIR